MISECSILSVAKKFTSNKEYKKALSCYQLFKVVNEDLADTVRANEIFLQKKIIVSSDDNQLIMEIPVFNNMDYTLECFWRVIKKSPFDVRVDIIQGTAENSYLLAWFDMDDIKAYRNLISTNSALDIKHFLEETGFFDAQFYQNQYKPALNGLDALTHFVQYGLAEGKLPARWFDLHVGTDQTISKIVTEAMHGRASRTTCPKVSVLVPVFNNAQYLHECIDSIVNQTLDDIEIIIINDGSTDQNAIDILNDYAQKDDRIRLIHKKNTGYGHSMNCGLLAAKGEFIGIVESDDYVINNMYQELYVHAKNNNIDFVKADFYRFERDKSGKLKCYINSISNKNFYYNRVINPEKERIVFSFVMNTWSGIYKRDFLKENDIFHNETPGASFQDNGFWFQTLCFAKRVLFINVPYYMNRRDNEGSSIYKKDKIFAIHFEYSFIYDKVFRHEWNKEKFLSIYQFYKYKAYCASINRSSNESKHDFINTFSQEFLLSQKKNELDLSYFSEGAKKNLSKIMTNPTEYYSEICKKAGKQEYYLGLPVDFEQSKDNYKITVIIPVYNNSKYLKECLKSALSQDIREIEIICIDDGSSDDSYKILTEVQELDRRVVVRRQKNRGAGIARNNALSIARGEFVAFLDADDFYPSNDVLSSLYRKAVRNNVHICGGSFSHIKNGQKYTNYAGRYSSYTFKNEGLIQYNEYQFDYGYTRFLYRREFIESNKLIFPSYLRFQDPPFFVKAMILSKEFYSVPMVTYCYRKDKNRVAWTDEKINDVVRGCTDNLKMSRDSSLCLLHRDTVEHLSVEFFNVILKGIHRENIKLIDLIISANEFVSPELLIKSGYQLDTKKNYLLKPLKYICRSTIDM